MTRIHRKQPKRKANIVHLGLGAFFRAHAAMIIEDVLNKDDRSWGIVGACLRSPDTRDKLAEQDNVYTAVELASARRRYRQVEILCDVIFVPDDPMALIQRMADPAIKIVTLTVTEKGYCHIPATGQLDRQNPEVQHDLGNPTPVTAVGYIVRALALRRERGARPFTVVSCDNLAQNGKVVRAVVLEMAQIIDPELAQWIAAEGRFPSSMVDRIVPAITENDVNTLVDKLGVVDSAPVVHEPYLQWVIEDDFVDGIRPDLSRAKGVTMVADVQPFETLKLRLLNGAHSSLAYLGILAGHRTIVQTVSDKVLREFIQRLWTAELVPSLRPPDGVDPEDYVNVLLERFSNRAIHHQLLQIAADGSQKIPQRLIAPILDNNRAGRVSPGLCLALAAWLRFLEGVDDHGRRLDLQDPFGERLSGLMKSDLDLVTKIRRVLNVTEIFGASLPNTLPDSVISSYQNLQTLGAKESIRRYLDTKV